MNGLMFYLRRPTPITHGHASYIDSPWALTSISQAQFWGRDFAGAYGDGAARRVPVDHHLRLGDARDRLRQAGPGLHARRRSPSRCGRR